MKLTPLDIRKHEFARRFRGYDPEEVRPFLDMVSQQWDELQEEVRHTRDRVRELEGKLAHYEKVEEALQQALESAKETAQRTQFHAEERAKLIVEQAELRAEQVLREAEQDRFRLRQDVSKLTHRHAEVTARLRHFLMSELEILAQHEDERPIGFMKLIPAREAESLPEPPEQPPAPQEVPREAPPRESAAAAAPPPAEARAPREEDREAAEPAPIGGPFQAEEPRAGAAALARDRPPATDARDAEPPDPAGRGEQEVEDEPPSTTYADLYARAASRPQPHEQIGELAESGSIEEDDDEEEEPGWNLRQIVAEHEDEQRAHEHEPRRTERDQIRRIIEDLD